MGDGVGDHDDAIGRDLLGPGSGHLAVEQARVDADGRDLDVAVTQNRSLGNRAGGCGSCHLSGLLGGNHVLGLGADAVLGLGEDLLGHLKGGIGRHARAVRGDEHGKVEARQGDPTVMALLLKQARDLVEGGAAPQVDQKQGLLGVVEGRDGIQELLVHVVGTHVRSQGDCRDVM